MRGAAWILLMAIGAGCRSAAPAGPYWPITGEARQTSKAEVLNREAADLLSSDPERAEELLREALTLDVFFGPAHNNLGVLLLQEGQLYEAANEFEWARKLLPGHPDPRMNLAITLERAGDVEEAVASYRAALEVHPGHIASIQGLTRLELLNGVEAEGTRERLEEIALRGETPAWREWARERLRAGQGR